MENQNNNYKNALERVKKIKGFYGHLTVYIIVNAIILIIKFAEHGMDGLINNSHKIFLFWGVGLLIHWFNVFGINVILGKDWEKRKIDEYMNNQDKWE